ncbi:GGDEF and EAL domain-containing protein [Lichenibacterium minor]|uniref:GGDEF and EAL domain-containing protein n=1 Tax=Lichenibacterium minor TaxID=2316528 RepID=A0A4Q2U997_9HYPH|nr:EAL domain-containing protein [Lichenibacterium minor]RYC33379.1 GGDEF and EAL domain-containing protein [Lichenibacterium minor]
MQPDTPRPRDAERATLDVLKSYSLDGPAPEGAFEHVVRLAADLFEVPTALVSFDDGCEQLVASARVGFDGRATRRDVSFCTHAMARGDVMVVPDALDDPRFRHNPMVTGEPFIRFYAGVPIVTPKGHRLGAICVIDAVPRPPLTERQCGLLRSLARIVMDQLEQRRLDTMRRAAMRMAAATPDAIVCSDDAGAVTFWNAAAERIFGHTRDEMVGRPLATLVPAEFRPRHRELMARRFAEGEDAAPRTVEAIGLRRDGTRVPIEISLATWRDGDHVNVGSIIRDLSERDRTRERVRHLTHFDRLTDLPNRAQFLERVDHALSTVDRFAVLQVGLDRFKAVNGTLGTAAGDRVLVAAAGRVRAAVGAAAVVARLGADEFGVLVAGADAAALAAALARSLVERLGEPFPVGGALCHLGASVGVVLAPDPSVALGADCVLKRALLALQQAKMAGGRRFEVFEPQLGERAEERHRIEGELRGALERGEFELHVQPQVQLPGGGLVGAEALLRWRHPERGLLSPAAFLPVLETSDMAVPVGRWIIREACAFAALMDARGVPLRMGINLFAAQLRDPGLFDVVADALAATGLPGPLCELEITETTVLGLDESVIAPLRRLRGLGVGVAFDDYGTGYASLSLLKRYPLTRLKIDREFVRDLRTDPDDAAIVKAVIALGASLGLDVIAEGIETPEQASALVGFGCREAQGYLFGKPMPMADFAACRAAPPPRKSA